MSSQSQANYARLSRFIGTVWVWAPRLFEEVLPEGGTCPLTICGSLQGTPLRKSTAAHRFQLVSFSYSFIQTSQRRHQASSLAANTVAVPRAVIAQVKHVARRAWITGWRFWRRAIISLIPPVFCPRKARTLTYCPVFSIWSILTVAGARYAGLTGLWRGSPDLYGFFVPDS